MKMLVSAAAAALLIALPATAGHHGDKGEKAEKAESAKGDYVKPTSDIVETAAAAGSFSTLLAAAQAAGLVDALKGDGPLTVFAPTDTAFAKLPDGTVATLLRPENKGALTNVLVYHAVAGSVTSADLLRLIEQGGGEAKITRLANQQLTARLSGDTIVITDAKGRATAVTQADVSTANGIIHVTDGVFLPA